MKTTIHQLNHNETADFRCLVEIFKTVFDNEEAVASEEKLAWLLAKPDFMVFVVKHENIVVGGLTVYVLHHYYEAKPSAYIYDVGISTDYQGKGLGKALMSAVCDFCQKNGFAEAYVEAEEEDTDAVNFYRKTKFDHELGARHFTYSF